MCNLLSFLPIRGGGGGLLDFQDSGGGEDLTRGSGNSGEFETPVGAMLWVLWPLLLGHILCTHS